MTGETLRRSFEEIVGNAIYLRFGFHLADPEVGGEVIDDSQEVDFLKYSLSALGPSDGRVAGVTKGAFVIFFETFDWRQP